MLKSKLVNCHLNIPKLKAGIGNGIYQSESVELPTNSAEKLRWASEILRTC